MSTPQCQQHQQSVMAGQAAAITINASQFGTQTAVAVGYQAQTQQRMLDWLQEWWSGFNRDYFDERLRLPQLGLDLKEPGCLGVCRKSIAFGGQVQISLNYQLAFATLTRWPGPGGVGRFVEDLLLRLTVQQFVLEVHNDEERRHQGFGPLFVNQAN